jgi:ssDNA-binding Zn-finger/Zn-ribbon topoisomerase 1
MGRKRITQQEYINRANSIHQSKYDYSMTNYTTMADKITVSCPTHGLFEVLASNHVKQLKTPSTQHLAANGCPKCGVLSVIQRNKQGRRPFADFVREAEETHNGQYQYSEEGYRGVDNKVNITCPHHGVFQQQGSNHLRGTGCPKCKNSRGETQIARSLTTHGIPYMQQHSFEGCIGDAGKPLKYDFWLPSINTAIEYDGEQHFHPVRFHQGMTNEQAVQMFERTVRYDKYKDAFAETVGIKLIRIPYFNRCWIGDIIAGLV